MAINLQKGQKVSLSKDNPGLSKVVVGLGWDAAKQGGFLGIGGAPANIDCDASALLLRNGKLVDQGDIVYFGNLKHASGTVTHMGDNLTGEGEGDDEQIVIELSRVPERYDRIVIVVNIYDCVSRKQDFGMIKNAFIRIVNAADDRELLKYDLSGDYKGRTAMIFGELYRKSGEWRFGAVGEGVKAPSLAELAQRYA